MKMKVSGDFRARNQQK